MSEEIVFSELLSQVEKSGFTFSALPANEYDTRIADASVRQTANQKNKIVVRFEVTSGPYAGRTVFNDFVLTPGNPNAMVIFFRQMAAMGLDGAYFSANPSLQKVADDLKGKEQRLRLGIRNWQGVDRNSVLQIMPVTGQVKLPVMPPGLGRPAPASPPPPAPPSLPVPEPSAAPVPAPAPAMPPQPPASSPAPQVPSEAPRPAFSPPPGFSTPPAVFIPDAKPAAPEPEVVPDEDDVDAPVVVAAAPQGAGSPPQLPF